jgi:hypothetical protein
MTVLVRDPRVRIVELSEYAGLRDADRTLAAQLSDAFAMALGSGPIG